LVGGDAVEIAHAFDWTLHRAQRSMSF
jgi:hypothetical protein